MTAPAAEAADEPAAGHAATPAGLAADADIVPLPSDPREVWLRGSEAVGGLAVDFAAAARSVAWRDDLLVVTLPADATTATAFLRRPEVTASIGMALTGLAGRPIRYTIASAAAEAGAAPAAPSPRPPAAATQAARLKAAADHPLVARVRAVFDAAIRTVEPPRRAEEAGAANRAASAATLTADEDERDAAVVVDEDAEGSIDG